MARASQVIVLAEDRHQQRFIHRYLERLHFSLHDIRFEPLSSASGEQWVRERYATAVRAYRARSARAETALVVAIDSDTGGLDRRIRQLEDALRQAVLSPRAADERIVHLIPKRNIETWILNLNGRAVDEETDYSRDHGIEQIGIAATTFFDWSRPNAEPSAQCVPSLRVAIDEVKRLE